MDDLEHALGITSGTSSSIPGSTPKSASPSESATAHFLASTTLESLSGSVTRTSTPPPTSSVTTLATPQATPITGGGGNSTEPHAVFAHVIVGNTYNYTVTNWVQDIALAASKGIDAFALNVGTDSWEPSQIANAYAAAGQYNGNLLTANEPSCNGTNSSAAAPFKLFLSFDMSSFPCLNASDAEPLQTYIKTYANNTSQMTYHGRVLVSTFAGEACTFGADSLNQAWADVLKPGNGTLPDVWFIPSFSVDPTTFSNLTVIDGAFHWNSGWPMGNYNVTFAPDVSYISNLENRTYMAAVSPWFFTHYGKDTFNKNFIYRGDDWLLSQRWEMLVANRTSVPLTQVLTWNDFGESHYVGPVQGMQPMSQQWVDGMDHSAWLDLMKYYITAYKTGSYPDIRKDRVFLWSRLHPANATAPDDVGMPDNAQWTQDYLWAVALLTEPANVTLSCGNSSHTALAPAGLSKLKLQLSDSCTANATVVRNSSVALGFAPDGLNYTTRPASYNFNAFVAASPE
ncbi:glycoside hydrolase family 71 protein [Trametes maxima]|nr:glycoside hydrolase family 71 protein [Trametes maxima]